MLRFAARRILYMIPTLIVVSILSFIIIQLPPGDYLTTVVTNMRASGEVVDEACAFARTYVEVPERRTQYRKWLAWVKRIFPRRSHCPTNYRGESKSKPPECDYC